MVRHAGPVNAAIVNLTHPDHYLHWGFIQLSLANGIVIVAMVLVFALALVLPFRSRGRSGR